MSLTLALLIAAVLSGCGPATQEVHFPDPNLEGRIRGAIDKPTGAILQSELDEITSLSVVFAKNLSGLEHCTNLSKLWIAIGDIEDLSSLAGLTSLTQLWLLDCQITDISALSGLTNLTYLAIDDNNITDVTPLSNLYNLEELHISRNYISDIEPLVDNTGLSEGDEVILQYNPLSDTSINTYIPQLEARGVDVEYEQE